MKVCPVCREENPERARFCLACGTQLGEVARQGREERKIVTVLFADAKGKAQPVAVWRAVEPRSRLGIDFEQAPSAPLVGRQRELDLLFGAIARAGERLLAAGRGPEGEAQLVRALDFFRSVRAIAYLQEGERLLARSA